MPDDRVGVHWVVVDNAPALHAALSWSFPPHHGSAGSRMLRRLVSKFNVSVPSEVCPEVDALEPFPSERNRQFTGDEVFFSDHLCRASLPRERRGLVGACRVDLGPGGCRDSNLEEMESKHSWMEKSRLRLLAAAAAFQRYQWYLNNGRLRSTVACQQAALLGACPHSR